MRGTLALDGWARERWERGLLEEDALSLIARRAAVLGHTSLSAERHPPEHWGLGEVGGSWAQDGREHLLAWFEAILPDAGRAVAPLPACYAVVAQALGRVGSVALAAVDAIVPLAAAPTAGRLALERDWVALPVPGAKPLRLAVTLDAGARTPSPAELASVVRELGDPVVADVAAAPDGERARGRPAFLGRPFSTGAVSLGVSVPAWDVDAGAWIVGLVACACGRDGASSELLISVRARGDGPAGLA